MKILIIRFSALGDVAMTVPVVDALARRYPEHEFMFVSRPFATSLYACMPHNVRFKAVDLKQYAGLKGLYRLFKELKAERFDAVADLHNVLRTKVLRVFFSLSGLKVASIEKGRKEKKALIKNGYQKTPPLASSFSRYENVFRRLGLNVKTEFHSVFAYQDADGEGSIDHLVGKKGNEHWIGIAPFAAHPGKILPMETMEEVISILSSKGHRIFLFGGGKQEKEVMEAWESRYPQVVSLAGKLKMNEELALMNRLDVMVSMDSANMHLASLVATPVVSVWGATHPSAGFMGWNQSFMDAVQLELSCRPCSIYGNKPCKRGDYACLKQIKATEIVDKINEKL